MSEDKIFVSADSAKKKDGVPAEQKFPGRAEKKPVEIVIKKDPIKDYFDEKKNYVKLSYLPEENLFKIDVIVNKWDRGDIERRVAEKILSNDMVEMYKKILSEKGSVQLPKYVVEVHGKNKEEVYKFINEYLREILSKRASELFKPPSNWKKQVGLSVGVLALSIGGAYGLGLFEKISSKFSEWLGFQGNGGYEAGYKAGYADAIGQANKTIIGLSKMIGEMQRYIGEALSYLNPVRDYLDQLSQNIAGIKQSSISLKSLAEERISKINQEIQRLIQGREFIWSNGKTTRVSADYDGDGQVDAWQDENGVWHYDEDSGNPVIPIHKDVVSGETTYYEHVNIANAFEDKCIEYRAALEDLNAWKQVKILADSIENNATVSADLIARTRIAVENAYRELERAQKALYVREYVGSSTGVKAKVKEGIAKVKWFTIKHPNLTSMMKIGALVSAFTALAYVSPLAYGAYWVGRNVYVAIKGIRSNSKWKRNYHGVLSLDKLGEVIA